MITIETVEQIPLLADLTLAQKEQIADRAADLHVQPGEWVIQEGELSSFYVLLSGSLSVIKMLRDVERQVNRYQPGDYFGELPLLLGSTSVISVKALEASRILKLEPLDFQRLLINIPTVSHQLLKTMAGRVERLQQFAITSVPTSVQVIGFRWDPDCHGVRDFLTRNHVAFSWLDPSDEAAQVILQKAGDTCPIVVLADGSLLIKPSRRELAAKLGFQTTPSHEIYDVAILGGGPAGLAAAVYGASEGLHTLLIDREAPGGQAGTSSRIENYLGFPSGLSGDELSHRSWQQAHRFGAEILVARSVEALDLETKQRGIILDGEERVNARAIVIATGVSWRKLSVPGLDPLIGRGVFYGAARTEAAGTRGKDIYLVGGGNSAGQAAIYFSNYANSVTILVRGDGLEATMSQYLIDQIATKSNIKVRVHQEVIAAEGQEHLEAIVVRDKFNQTQEKLPTNDLFILIGADARTEWLPQSVVRDVDGYLFTGRDVTMDSAGKSLWLLERDPYLLETSVPGVFAAGDVRHASIKRVASGVGEGSMSIAFIHQYLMNEANV